MNPILYLNTFQIPTGLPHPDDNTPVDLTKTSDLVIYVILPAIIVILYLVILKRKKNKKN